MDQHDMTNIDAPQPDGCSIATGQSAAAIFRASRERLEADILALLRKFHEETGMAPRAVDVGALDGCRAGELPGCLAITGVRVTVEL